MEKTHWVYIMASRSKCLYIGMTSDLRRRVLQHKFGLIPGFTGRYQVRRLVYYEQQPDQRAAELREKQLKGWLRSRKVELIESMNPEWEDFANRW